jgi:hypothetical protein
VFTFASREGRSHASHLHALDIKTSQEFVHGQTTHVVSQKRNLPKVLQGLLAGTHIVTGNYLEAVISAGTLQNSDPEHYKASKLEEDFDTWWPKEREYIPPMGAEPVPRPEQMLEPDTGRSEIFSGLTFVFLNEGQYTSLQEPIATGGGKSLLFDLQFGETTIEDYVEFVRNVAGEKRRSKSTDGSLPVITIRLSNYPAGMEDWATNFVTGVDQALHQRSIQQNEFLDAVVTKDTSPLQRPPPEIEVVSSIPEKDSEEASAHVRGPTTRSRSVSLAPETKPGSTEEPPKVIPRKRAMRRAVTQSRFTGFDDYEPPTKARKIQEDSIPEDVKVSQPTQRGFLGSQAPVSSTQASRRRESPVRETIEEVEEDELFPAAAALKKRRAATRGASASVEPGAAAPAAHIKTKGEKVLEQLQRAKRKVAKEVDVREQTRLQLREQEEKRKADEESLREALEGVDISEIRGLVKVEDMEVKPRHNIPAQRNRADGERWNDEWNGRKNFKKFRRRGAERGPQPQKVIVALQEVSQKKGFGLGDPFFLEEAEKPKRSTEERRDKRRTGRKPDDSSEPEQGFTRRRRDENHEVVDVEDSEMDEDEDVQESVGTLSRTQRVAETQVTGTQSQSQTQTQRKRAPVTVAAGQPPAKRNRSVRADDDSDAEETGFRLRRRR